jgi:hypothetical protein
VHVQRGAALDQDVHRAVLFLGDWLAAWRSLPVKTMSLVLVATVRGT